MIEHIYYKNGKRVLELSLVSGKWTPEMKIQAIMYYKVLGLDIIFN